MNKHGAEILSSAARRVLDTLGVKRVGEIVRRSAAMIYKWSDFSLHYYPNLQQALELDAEVIRSGHGTPPFLVAYASLLRQVRPSVKFVNTEPLSNAMQIVTVAGQILVDLCSRTGAASDDHGNEIAPKDLWQKLTELDALVIALRWRVENDPAGIMQVQEATPKRKRRSRAFGKPTS
jgi:hypothetical protein